MYPVIRNKILAVAVSIFLSGCLFYPKKTVYYDPECNITTEKLTLEIEFADGSGHVCQSTNGCLFFYLGVGVVSAAISGSIVAVSNSINWLERQSKC